MRAIADDIWVAEDSMKMPLMKLSVRSTVIRLNDNTLMVISPIRPTPKWIQEINELGVVRYIVAPNCLHHLFLNKFAVNFPEAEIWGPTDLFDKRADIQFSEALDARKAYPWSEHVDMFSVQAKAPVMEEFVFFHKKSRTLIVTDLFFNWQNFNNWIESAFARINGAYKKLTMTRMAKISFKDKESLTEFADWAEERKPQNVIVAHGDLVLGNAQERLREPLQKLRWS